MAGSGRAGNPAFGISATHELSGKCCLGRWIGLGTAQLVVSMTMVFIIFAVMVGATELPERYAEWATTYAKPLARAYLKAIRKQAHDPERLAQEIARKSVRKLYNILKVLVVAAVAYIAGKNA